MSLFSLETEELVATDPLRERFAALDPNELSPRQALELVFELGKLIDKPQVG